MSVRSDHELPRSQADVSDDARLGTDQGPFEGQEALIGTNAPKPFSPMRGDIWPARCPGPQCGHRAALDGRAFESPDAAQGAGGTR